MSFEMRNNTAMSKRAEQLRRWEESDTAREPDYPKNEAGRRIKFSSGCVFLAACLSGERDEVLRLLEQGADIDTANTDGLTALHQACIDDNLEMVEFLVHNGADVNRQDNEGWTPLHATASCGFLSIARYLIESGANLASVSSDGELVVDLADNDRMETLLRKTIDEQGIDCDEARQSEERMMLNDAKNWLRSDASEADKPHPRTGATALHVAAAKGYSKVLSLLLATRSDVDKQDNDGWTPLHAAAHWGQKDAAQMLVAALADMDIKNYAGQTIFEVADSSILRYLEELRKNNKRNKRRPASQIRISDGMDNHIDTTPSKVFRVESKDSKHVDDDKTKPAATEPVKTLSKDIITVPEEDTPWRRSGSLRSRQQPDSPPKNTLPTSAEKEPAATTPAVAVVKVPPTAPAQPTAESEVILRRTQSFENDDKKTVLSPVVGSPVIAPPPSVVTMPTATVQQSGPVRRSAAEELVRSQFNAFRNMPSPGIQLERTFGRQTRHGGSTQSLNKMPDPTLPLGAARNAASITDLPTGQKNIAAIGQPLATVNVQPVAAATAAKELPITTTTTTSAAEATTEPANVTTSRSKFAPANIFKNFFKSFVPPSRDEESETQRKAHAKRVRETRRSTQGVTLDEIKSAEELIKKNNFNNNNNFKLEDVVVTLAAPATVNTTVSTTGAVTITPQRRSNQSGFETAVRPVSAAVEQVNDRVKDTTTTTNTSNTSNTNTAAAATNSSSSSNSSAGSTASSEVVTLPLRRSKATDEDKENDKENDSRSAQATQAVIQRRRRPKRRSTGVVHVDMDDIDPDRQEGTDGAEEKESGSERTSRSRLGSTSSMVSDGNDLKSDSTENGDHIDYKALYEAAKLDNDKLKQQLKKKDEDLSSAKATVDRFANATTKNSLSELEKRERRAMERKLSEMEEELKHLEALKTENQRLKDENGALIRVISKLSK